MSDIIVRAAGAADRDALLQLNPALDASVNGELLVAERNGRIVAGVQFRRAIGLDLPRYWYHVGAVVHAAAELRLFHQQRTLMLNNDYTGAGELTDFVWTPSLDVAERDAAMRALARAALSQLAGSCATVIVELPGVRDASGRSPFWSGLGRHFYSGDPRAAHERFGEAWVSHVASLLPRDPLIVSFLAKEAQSAIGAVAPEAESLLQALLADGFRHNRYVTIDDGGPVLEASLEG